MNFGIVYFKEPKVENRQWRDLYKKEGRNISQIVLSLIHQKAYEFAKQFCHGKVILEIGCGAGYGAKYLSIVAKEVIAVDLNEESINYAQKDYPSFNLTFKKINNGCLLPFNSDTFNVVVLFQVIEHIPPEKVKSHLLEMKRILKSDGTLLITTPNRKFRLLPLQSPHNPHHYTEYTPKGLEKILEKVFVKIEIFGLRGKPEIELIEKNRVKQNPYEAYIRNPLINLMNFFLPQEIIFKIKKIRNEFNCKFFNHSLINEAKQNEPDLQNFSLKDLFYTKDSLNKSIDLLAICKNYKLKGEI